MDGLPLEEEEMHTSEGDDTDKDPQEPSQEAATNAAETIRSSSRKCRASVISLEVSEQDSFNWNALFATEEG